MMYIVLVKHTSIQDGAKYFENSIDLHGLQSDDAENRNNYSRFVFQRTRL
jgi:hypothetical protein